MFCKHCGKEMPAGAEICSSCRRRQDEGSLESKILTGISYAVANVISIATLPVLFLIGFMNLEKHYGMTENSWAPGEYSVLPEEIKPIMFAVLAFSVIFTACSAIYQFQSGGEKKYRALVLVIYIAINVYLGNMLITG